MNRREAIAYLFIMAFGAIWAYGKYAMYQSFLMNTFDYGIFEDIAYNIVNHHSFFNWTEYFLHGARTHFQVHFQPIIVLYALGVKFFGGWSLGVIDAISWIVAGIIFVNLAKREGRDPLYWSLFWVLNPITFTFFFDVHPINFALPFGILTVYGALKKNKKLLVLGIAGLFIVKEDTGLLLVATGLYIIGDEILEIFEKPVKTVKKIAKEKKYGVLILLIGILMIVVSSGIIFAFGRAWKMNVYTTSKAMIFTTMGLFFFILDIILVGLPFIKDNKLAFAIGLLPLFAENFLSDRSTQVVYWFQYYVYIAAFSSVVLVVNGIDPKYKKKFLGVLFVAFLVFSPGIMGVSRTPVMKYVGVGNVNNGLLSYELGYIQNKDIYDEIHSQATSIILSEIQRSGYVFVGPKLYPVAMEINPDKVYPGFVFFARNREIYPVMERVYLVAPIPNCRGVCVPVAKEQTYIINISGLQTGIQKT